MEIVKRLVVASSVVGRRDEQVEPRGFYSKEAILYKTCHYTFVPIFIECRTPREWQPTSVLLPGEFHGQRSLAGYSPRDLKESDMTEQLIHTHTHTHTGPRHLELHSAAHLNLNAAIDLLYAMKCDRK